MPRNFVDVEGPIRTWLRGHAQLIPVFGSRIFFGTPRGGTTTPWITMTRVGGLPNLYTPEDYPLIQMDVWGGIKDRAATAVAAYHLASVIESASEKAPYYVGPVMIPAVAVVGFPRWLPDVDSDRARFVVQVRFIVIARDQVHVS